MKQALYLSGRSNLTHIIFEKALMYPGHRNLSEETSGTVLFPMRHLPIAKTVGLTSVCQKHTSSNI